MEIFRDMHGKSPTPDQAIAAVARRQQRNITREQLLALGLGSDAIHHRSQSGRLYRVHTGVYSVGGPPQTMLERAAAAVLACGPGAALSHGSALTLWGFQKDWRTPFHVTVPRDRRRPDIAIHRVKGLTRADIRTQLGIRATSPARTVLDCAPDLPSPGLTRIVADGLRAGLLHRAALDDVLDRFPHHPGAALLHSLRHEAPPGTPTRSEFEDAFVAFCRRYDLPVPAVNVRPFGREADAYFADAKLIVELDGWDFHHDRRAFESDRDRDADALAAGAATVRITWERFTTAPGREAQRLTEILRLRRRT